MDTDLILRNVEVECAACCFFFGSLQLIRFKGIHRGETSSCLGNISPGALSGRAEFSEVERMLRCVHGGNLVYVNMRQMFRPSGSRRLFTPARRCPVLACLWCPPRPCANNIGLSPRERSAEPRYRRRQQRQQRQRRLQR